MSGHKKNKNKSSEKKSDAAAQKKADVGHAPKFAAVLKQMSHGQLFIDRELSWLDFNERVLVEAEDTSNPVLERAKFLAIFSTNLDEVRGISSIYVRHATLLCLFSLLFSFFLPF